MGNRKQPFGYKIMDGQIVLCPHEADLVRIVFTGYLGGMSFKALAEKMEQQPIRYDSDKAWNKNMIARMLEDSRYTGDSGWPCIIDTYIYSAAQEKRQDGKGISRQSETEKAVRQIIGQAPPHSVVLKVESLIHQLIQEPAQIEVPHSLTNTECVSIRKELDDALLQLPVDEDKVNALLRQSAIACYQAIDPNEYETQRLRNTFQNACPDQRLIAELIRSTVSEIIIDGTGAVRLRLKNQQIYEGVKNHEN